VGYQISEKVCGLLVTRYDTMIQYMNVTGGRADRQTLNDGIGRAT